MQQKENQKLVRKVKDFKTTPTTILPSTVCIETVNLGDDSSSDNGQVLYYCETDRNGNKTWKCYFLEKALGEGTFGQVWLVYPIKDDGSIDDSPEQAKALKVINCNTETEKEDLKEEVKLGNQNAFNHAVYLNPNDQYHTEALVLMDYAPGEEPTDENLKNLSFPQRIQAIMQLCMAVNIVHHKTPRTGSAVVHADIKPENIKIAVRSKKDKTGQKDLSVIEAYLLDFGISKRLLNDSPKPISVSETIGTPNYMSPKLWNKGDISRKADIYSLVPVFGMILGKTEAQVLEHKNNISYSGGAEGSFQHLSAEFNIQLDVILPPGSEYHPLKTYLERFLAKMQAKTYEEQPDTDEVLKFFTLMNQVCLEFQVQSEQNKNKDFKVDQIADFEDFKTEFELLIAGDYAINKLKQRINGELANTKLPENLKASAKKILNIDKDYLLDPADKMYLLTLLAESLAHYNHHRNKLTVGNQTLEDLRVYSVKCQSSDSPYVRALMTDINHYLGVLAPDYPLAVINVKESIQRNLADQSVPDALRTAAQQVLTDIDALKDFSDKIKPLRLLSESLTQYGKKQSVNAETLKKMHDYSLQCQGSPSPKLKAVGIGMMVLGIGLIVLGSLCLTASLGLMATGVLAPLSMIGVAGSGAMIGTGFASAIGGVGLFQKSKATGLSKSVSQFVETASNKP